MRETGKRLAGGKPEKPKKKKRDWKLIVLIILAVLLALVLAGVLVWKSLFVRPELPQRDPGPQIGTGDSGGITTAPGKNSDIDWGEGIRPRADGLRKSEDYWTVLILGRDTGGGGNTDTMLLASYDVTNQKATVMSIPRDTMVNVPWDIKRINSVYNYYGGGERGIQHLYKEISQLVGFEPDFQVVVEWEAVGEIVDAMGGVYFDVPRNMNYDDDYQDLHIHQAKGYRLLTGSDAMQVLRYRHDNNAKYGYADGDLGRIKTQQAFLTAMVEQLLKVKNMTKIGDFITVFQNNVETDMSFQNILWFAQSAVFGGLKMEDVQFVTMPNTGKYVYSRSVGNNQSYVVPNAKQLLELVNNDLSPFVETFTISDLDIMSVNSDGSIRSSTGYVEDKAAARPPVRPSTKPKEDDPAGEGEGGDPNETQDPNGTTTPGGPIVIDPTDPNGTQNPDQPGGVLDPNQPGNSVDPNQPGGVTGTEPPGGGELPDPGQTDPGGAAPGTDTPAPGDPPSDPALEVPQDPGFTIIEPPPME